MHVSAETVSECVRANVMRVRLPPLAANTGLFVMIIIQAGAVGAGLRICQQRS